ncbi:MAG: universal stress protein [Vampirovibrionales bacterium]|nr:universal stress protein [Vampirovibrionales bacterium]
MKPSADSSPGSTSAAGADTAARRLKLMLEGHLDGAWAIPDLPRWFRPDNLDVSLAQVMDCVSHKGWIQMDPDMFWRNISDRKDEIEQIRQQFYQTMTQHQFHVASDSVCDTSDEACQFNLDEIKRLHPDLVAIVAKENPLRDKDASSFILRIARHAPSSVLVIRRPLKDPARMRVLFATDGSEVSNHAAARLPQLLRTDAMDVTVMTILENVAYMENPVIAPYVNAEAVEEALRQNGSMIVEMTRDVLQAEGINVVDTKVACGAPSAELLRQADALDPDLVVMGSHNRRGLPGWLLGSVSYRMVQSSHQSVLVVR